jgi:hypothetical protein
MNTIALTKGAGEGFLPVGQGMVGILGAGGMLAGRVPS